MCIRDRGIAGNPQRLQNWINNNIISPDALNPLPGGFWFGAELDTPSWDNASTLGQQSAALASIVIPITVAGPIPPELVVLQADMQDIAAQGLQQIGIIVSVQKDANGNLLVIGENGSMQLNTNGSALITSSNSQIASQYEYGKGNTGSGLAKSHLIL